MIHTIDNSELAHEDRTSENFKYQKELTGKLDTLSGDFDQNIINEIVLWKVNRYARLSEKAFELLNKIDDRSSDLDEDLSRHVLIALLNCNGIQLPMASTILRFKKPNIYQIIDQRVFRFLYGEVATYPRDKNDAAALYLRYLRDLRTKCDKHSIPFIEADRILYLADKRLNKSQRLNNY